MDTHSRRFVVKSTRVVTSTGVRSGGVFVDDGLIAGLFSGHQIPGDVPVDDVGDAVVMAGLVDTHVHINEPGRTEWEGFVTATRAACAGGVTMLVDMPLNSNPVTTNVGALLQKIKASIGKCWIDCGFYGGFIPGNLADIFPLIEAGVLGIKAFLVPSGIDEFPNVTQSDLRSGMPIIAKTGVPLLVHAELMSSESGKVDVAREDSYQSYLASRPSQWEEDAIAVMIHLSRETHCRVHIVHLATAAALPLIERARAEGLAISVETCPHYLYFFAEEIPDGDTRFKCAPPIRRRAHREGLWVGLDNGAIDFIVTDHSPCPPDLKRLSVGDFMGSWGGIASIQLRLPVVWTVARQRGFGLTEMAKWLCEGPAKSVGLFPRKGSLEPGADADIVVWNPNASFEVMPESLFDRHKLTPYEGRRLFGRVDRTYLRGRPIFDKGQWISTPSGRIVLKDREYSSTL